MSTPPKHPDEIIRALECAGLGWSLDHTGRMIECRIWRWPDVIGRFRPDRVLPLAEMLQGAIRTIPANELPPAVLSTLSPGAGNADFNEALDLLCDCAGQFLIAADDGTLTHSYMSTEEWLCDFLVRQERLEPLGKGRFRWPMSTKTDSST